MFIRLDIQRLWYQSYACLSLAVHHFVCWKWGELPLDNLTPELQYYISPHADNRFRKAERLISRVVRITDPHVLPLPAVITDHTAAHARGMIRTHIFSTSSHISEILWMNPQFVIP